MQYADTVVVTSTAGCRKRRISDQLPCPKLATGNVASGMMGLDRCLSDLCALLLKYPWNFQNTFQKL